MLKRIIETNKPTIICILFLVEDDGLPCKLSFWGDSIAEDSLSLKSIRV